MRYYPNYFDDFFNDTKKQDTSTVLRTDIYEKDGYYQICMEVCGIQKENIQIVYEYFLFIYYFPYFSISIVGYTKFSPLSVIYQIEKRN